jgi:rare lipoprotein A
LPATTWAQQNEAVPGIALFSSSASPTLAARRGLLLAALLAALLPAIGCGGKKTVALAEPPPPTLTSRAPAKPAPKAAPAPAKPSAAATAIKVDPNAPAIWTEEGMTSWYGPNYHNKQAANGEIYDQNGMTAAHLTLPLNSIVRVVNLKTQQKVVLRITDRGPFVEDRILDLSVGAAKAIGAYQHGTALVRLDVLSAPKPIETGGRWCVQIGAFDTQEGALKLKEHLLKKYPGSQVLQFKGPTGWWVRIRVAGDDKEKTHEVMKHLKHNDPLAFMTRLD